MQTFHLFTRNFSIFFTRFYYYMEHNSYEFLRLKSKFLWISITRRYKKNHRRFRKKYYSSSRRREILVFSWDPFMSEFNRYVICSNFMTGKHIWRIFFLVFRNDFRIIFFRLLNNIKKMSWNEMIFLIKIIL